MFNLFNANWQSLKARKPKKKRSKTWIALTWLIRTCIIVWKILKIFFGDDS